MAGVLVLHRQQYNEFKHVYGIYCTFAINIHMHNEGHRFKLYASAVWAECLALIHIYQKNSAVELTSVHGARSRLPQIYVQ